MEQFLGDVDPVTVLIGMEANKLLGKLIRYPENKRGTTWNVIPSVEVCHCGEIPVLAIVSHLLVCAVDYRLSRKTEKLDDLLLSSVEDEFGEVVRVARIKQDAIFEKHLEMLRNKSHSDVGPARD